MLLLDYFKECAVLRNKINWMKNLLDVAIVRYNEIGKSLNIPLKDLFTDIKKQISPFQLNFVSKKKKEELVSYLLSYFFQTDVDTYAYNLYKIIWVVDRSDNINSKNHNSFYPI